MDEPMSFAQGPAFVTVHMLTRHILAITLCGALASVSVAFKKARKAEHVSFASRARQVHEVSNGFMCLFLCYSPITSPPAADFFYFLKPLGTGQPCVIFQGKTHLEEFRLRIGIGARCVRAEGSRSLA